MSVAAEEATIRQLVRERMELADTNDPDTIAAALVEDMPADMLRDAARHWVRHIAVALDSAYRNAAFAGRNGSTPGAGTRSAKWDGIKSAVRENPDVFVVMVPLSDGTRRPLGELDKRGVDMWREFHERQRDGHDKRIDYAAQIGKMLKAGQRVGDLERTKVEAVFNG